MRIPVDQGLIPKTEYPLQAIAEHTCPRDRVGYGNHQVVLLNAAVLVFIDDEILEACCMHVPDGSGLGHIDGPGTIF
jgi:hypothetical protein